LILANLQEKVDSKEAKAKDKEVEKQEVRTAKRT
jgi:hypothetical protein